MILYRPCYFIILSMMRTDLKIGLRKNDFWLIFGIVTFNYCFSMTSLYRLISNEWSSFKPSTKFLLPPICWKNVQISGSSKIWKLIHELVFLKDWSKQSLCAFKMNCPCCYSSSFLDLRNPISQNFTNPQLSS